MTNEHKYIDIVQFYKNEIRFHEESIQELKMMLELSEGCTSFTEMDYSVGAVPDPNISGRKDDE